MIEEAVFLTREIGSSIVIDISSLSKVMLCFSAEEQSTIKILDSVDGETFAPVDTVALKLGQEDFYLYEKIATKYLKVTLDLGKSLIKMVGLGKIQILQRG